MKFEAVLFDCDGVLVDSESITCGVLRDMLQEQGWTLSLRECMDLFVGKMVADERMRIERETGKPFTEAWLAEFRARRMQRWKPASSPSRISTPPFSNSMPPARAASPAPRAQTVSRSN